MAEQSFKIYKDTAERLDKNESDIASLKSIHDDYIRNMSAIFN